MTSDADLQKLIEQAKSREAIARAVERGGLPTDAEAEALYGELNAVRDRMENVVWRVQAICESDDGSDLPFTITLDDLGVLAVVVGEIENAVPELEKFAEELRLHLRRDLNTIRHNQLVATEGKRDA